MVAVAWTLVAIILAGMAAFFVDIRSEMRGLRSELRGEIASVRTDLGARIEARDRVLVEINTKVDAQGASLAEIHDDLRSQRDILARHLEAHAGH